MSASQSPVQRPPRVALVHDFLVSLRGAERVFLEMCAVWPDADIFTPVYNEQGTEGRFAHRRIYTSFLQKTRPSAGTFRAMLPFYPAAIESFDLSGYDLVVSSSSAWAHAVICGEGTVHVSYCHNPFRYAWNERARALDEWAEPLSRAFLRGFLRRWREWDWIAAQRVTQYVTNSETTRQRIGAYFGRESRVVYPPVEISRFTPGEPGEEYLVVSGLLSHKRIDDAVRAFTRLGMPLVVAGAGPDLKRLKAMAGPNVRFLGRVSDSEVARLMSGCRAFVVTSAEEFGIAAVEAQAAGRPVIARRAGGALETVVDGVTGCFWDGGPEELADAVRGFDPSAVDPAACVASARRFDSDMFESGMHREVARAVATAHKHAARRDGDAHPRQSRRPPPWAPAPSIPPRRI
ncbi:MAG: glycosyltransferase [Thermoleophilaceae bacterium]